MNRILFSVIHLELMLLKNLVCMCAALQMKAPQKNKQCLQHLTWKKSKEACNADISSAVFSRMCFRVLKESASNRHSRIYCTT